MVTIYSLDVLLFLFGTSLLFHVQLLELNCCFLTCIQVSQEAVQVVWYAHLFQNLPQFIVIHTVKGFGIVNKAEVDVFLEPSCFSMIQQLLAIWSLVSLPFLKPAWTSGSSNALGKHQFVIERILLMVINPTIVWEAFHHRFVLWC